MECVTLFSYLKDLLITFAFNNFDGFRMILSPFLPEDTTALYPQQPVAILNNFFKERQN